MQTMRSSTVPASRNAAAVAHGRATLKTRTGLDWTGKFAGIAKAAEALPDLESPGAWRLRGEKWFCSVADADLFAVTARPDGAGFGTRMQHRAARGAPHRAHAHAPTPVYTLRGPPPTPGPQRPATERRVQAPPPQRWGRGA